MTIGTNLSSAG